MVKKINKKVSVIIPSYKRVPFITRAINSVLNQTYNNIEVIVVDDNDSDSMDRKNMEKIMSQYSNDNRVVYLKHEKNKNGAAARNTGIRKAKGYYITFLDDDDFYLQNRIEELVNCLENNKEYDAVYTGGFIVNKNKIIKIFNATREDNLQNLLLNQYSFFMTGSNMFLKKEVVNEINGFDEEFFRHQDLEFLVRFLENHKIKAFNSHTVVKDEVSRVNLLNIDKSLKMRELYLKKFNKIINKYNKEEIYITNYKSLLLRCSKKNKEYNYIKNKLKTYNYNISLFDKLEYKIRNNFIGNIYYFFQTLYRSFNVNNVYIKEVKNIIKK